MAPANLARSHKHRLDHHCLSVQNGGRPECAPAFMRTVPGGRACRMCRTRQAKRAPPVAATQAQHKSRDDDRSAWHPFKSTPDPVSTSQPHPQPGVIRTKSGPENGQRKSAAPTSPLAICFVPIKCFFGVHKDLIRGLNRHLGLTVAPFGAKSLQIEAGIPSWGARFSFVTSRAET